MDWPKLHTVPQSSLAFILIGEQTKNIKYDKFLDGKFHFLFKNDLNDCLRDQRVTFAIVIKIGFV